jgi:hypothetical protein
MSIHRLIPAERATMTAIGVALLAAAFVPPAAARAHAVPTMAGKLACAGSQTVTYAPGLTDRPRSVTVHGETTLNRCVSTTDPGITAGTSDFSAVGRFSCTSGGYAGLRRVTWNNGRTSTLSFTSEVSVRLGVSVATIKGAVVSGEFTGQRWNGTFTMFTTKPVACATPRGLATAAGPVLVTIGSPSPGLVAPNKVHPIGA